MNRFVKNIQSANSWRKHRPNRCIIGDTILPQTGKKLTTKCGPEIGGCGGAIWCCIRKLQYRCATTIPHVHKSPKMFCKIYFLYDFRCTQTCWFRADAQHSTVFAATTCLSVRPSVRHSRYCL